MHEREGEGRCIASLILYYVQVTPAQSREFNRNCILFDFYDTHDLWHFISALALFFTFLVSLYVCVCTCVYVCVCTCVYVCVFVTCKTVLNMQSFEWAV